MSDKTIWNIKYPVPMPAFLNSRQGPVSPLVASLLGMRGICQTKEIEDFLFHKDIEHLTDPFALPDMQKSVKRIAAAIEHQEAIVVYGDYDVDGMTATALLTMVIQKLGGLVHYWIPDRQKEGYGLNQEALQQLKDQGSKLIVTVDCGISATEEAAFGKELGLDIIVTDHHQPPAVLPQAYALVNPKLNKIPGKDYDLAGVGVAFKLAWGLCHFFQQPDLVFDYLDLAAIGTVADLVPLLGDNRILVQKGLDCINSNPRLGIAALIKAAGMSDKEIQTGSIAFGLAPRLNASGRLAHGRSGVELLMAQQEAQAIKIAQELNEANRLRQDIENRIMAEALQQIEEAYDLTRDRIIVLASDQWHSGVIGIVASRLVEKYHRPVLMIQLEENEGKGSGRSIPGFNLYEALKHCAPNLLSFGGHELAAGLRISADQIPAFKQAIMNFASQHLREEDLLPVKTADMILAASLFTASLVKEISCLAPFGIGNPQPVFILSNALIKNIRTLGAEGNHLKFLVESGDLSFTAIAFNMAGRLPEFAAEKPIDLMLVPEINCWQHCEQLQLNVRDIRLHQHVQDNSNSISDLDKLYIDGMLWLQEGNERDILNKESFFTKVVGLSFKQRYLILDQIQSGDEVTLQPEPENPYDQNAIAVYYQEQKLGYLKAALARHLAQGMKEGNLYGAYIAQITGLDKENQGVNLFIYRKNEESEIPVNTALLTPPTDWRQYPKAKQDEFIRQALLNDRPYREKQQEALNSLKNGYNTLLIMGTGRGKSAVFQTMAARYAANNDITILVYPLRSLVNDQLHRFREKLGPLGLGIVSATGVMSPWERKDFFKSLYNQQVQVILTTPEFLVIHWEKFLPVQKQIRCLVIDEAHHITQYNRSGYKNLSDAWAKIGRPLVLATTATANEQAARQIRQCFNIQNVIAEAHCRSNLAIVDARAEKDKLAYLLKNLNESSRCIIYVNSRRQSFELATLLRSYLPYIKDQIGFYHGGLDRQQRQALETMFRQKEINIMVSTSAFGEGIDIADIRDVILYHLCFSLSEYNQLAGRAGRDGQAARIHLLYNKEDQTLNQLILQINAPDRDTLGSFYLYLRELAKKQNPISLTNREMASDIEFRGLKPIGERAIPTCLGILEELELVLREQDSGRRYIHLAPPPPTKLDLASSARYSESQHELAAYQRYLEIAFSADLDLLLESINRPISPDVKN